MQNSIISLQNISHHSHEKVFTDSKNIQKTGRNTCNLRENFT